VSDPIFSIIIPTFNSGKTLRRCLDSIFLQTCQRFEIYIIDNCSSDNTLEIIKEFECTCSRIYTESLIDDGIYDAMNKGISLANGEWLYFMGSDDTLYDRNVLARIAEETQTTKASIIYGNVIINGENQWNLNGKAFAGEFSLERLLRLNICHQAIFYHRSVFDKCGNYDLNYPVFADYAFNLKCFSKVTFSYLNLIIANFWVGGHSTTNHDLNFNNHRGTLFYKYFKLEIFGSPFLMSRLYLKRAAFSSLSSLNFAERLICLLAYAKLKGQSMVPWGMEQRSISDGWNI
jgi:glycosyltransferase involved in cell wall biosynthesis